MHSVSRDRAPAAIPFGTCEASIPITPLAPSTARECLTSWLRGQVPDFLLDNARLLVSELVTNSVVHADSITGATVRVRASLTPGVLRLEVGDTGKRGAVLPRAPDHDLGGGFGLHIVDTVASRWGVERSDGTQVWCELRR